VRAVEGAAITSLSGREALSFTGGVPTAKATAIRIDPVRVLGVRLDHNHRMHAVSRPGRLLRRVRNEALGTVSRVATADPIVALTFDDGPHPVYTPQLLDVLAEFDVRATFFMVGERAKDHPDVVRRVAAARHVIGNHTFDHPSFPLIGDRERRYQLRACHAALAPHGVRLFRPPHGHESLASHMSARTAGYEVIGWSAHAFDWKAHPSGWMLERLLGAIKPGRIVLLHDAIFRSPSPEAADRSEMVATVRSLLEVLSPRYRFVTVPALLRHGRAIRTWYQPPDHALLATLANYERYAAHQRRPSS